MNINILKFDSLESTNIEAIEQAKRGAGEGLCIVADQQSSGRGRSGRAWVSEKAAGLYFSIVLRPKIESEFLPLITLMAAVAVYDLLENLYLIKPDIKWPNDVLVNEEKICGILAETVETNKGRAVVVGIGINLDSSKLPVDITLTATSIKSETGQIPERNELLTALTKYFDYFYNILEGVGGAKSICEHWTTRSTYSENKSVKVSLENEILYGITKGLEPNGGLRILTEQGNLKVIHAGDIERIRPTSDNTA